MRAFREGFTLSRRESMCLGLMQKQLRILRHAHPHPGPTAVELSAYSSKHDFFDTSLKMIRTEHRELFSGRFTLGTPTHRCSEEHELQLLHDRFDRQFAVKQDRKSVV